MEELAYAFQSLSDSACWHWGLTCCFNRNKTFLGTKFLSNACFSWDLQAMDPFLSPVFTDGGIRWRPAEQPSNCQHPGHWCQWQYAHVWRGLLQCWCLHRHAARGNSPTGNQSTNCPLAFLPLFNSITPFPAIHFSFVTITKNISCTQSFMIRIYPCSYPVNCVDMKNLWNCSFHLIYNRGSQVRENVSLHPHCTVLTNPATGTIYFKS